MDIETQLDINEKRHFAADARYEQKMDKAERLIGHLCRAGKTVYYVCWNTPTGKFKMLEGEWCAVFDKAMTLV